MHNFCFFRCSASAKFFYHTLEKIFRQSNFLCIKKTSYAKILSNKLIQRKKNNKTPCKKYFGHFKNFAQNKKKFAEKKKKFAENEKYFALAEKYFAPARKNFAYEVRKKKSWPKFI